MPAAIQSLRPALRALTIGAALFRAAVLAAGVSALALLAGGQARAQNLLTNPGFETGAQSPWSISNGNNLLVTQPDMASSGLAHGGTKMWRLQGDNVALSQTVTLAGGNYSLSVWLASRTDAGAGYRLGPNVVLQLRDSGNNVVAPAASASPAIPYSPTTSTYVNWTRSYINLAAGNYTVYVNTGANTPGIFQQGWADDFSLTQVVNTTTTTAVATSGTPSTAGQNVTFTATIHPLTGTDVPTGSVQFKVDGANLGDPVTVTAGTSPDGTAAISTSALSVVGSPHAVTAEFTATGNFANSSGTLAGGQAVNSATTTAVATSGTPSTIGDSVTFTATIHPISGSVVPTGTVQFKVDGSNLGYPVEVTPGTSPDGTAVVSTSSLTVAGSPHEVTVVFSSADGVDRSTGTLSGGQTVDPGPAAVLVFTTAPANAYAGSPFGTQPMVKTQDEFGNNSTVGLAASEIVTIAIKSGTGTLAGTLTYDIGTAAGNGTITGNGLSLDQTGSFTLGATSTNLAEGESAAFTVQAANANRLLNPGFQDDAPAQDKTTAAPWTKVLNGGYQGIDLTGTMGGTPHGGNAHWRLQGNNTVLQQTVYLAAGNYSLGVWVCSRNEPTHHFVAGQFTLELLDNGSNVVTPSTFSSPDYTAPLGTYVNWTRSYVNLPAGDYTVKVSNGVGAGANQGWVDDFTLTESSPSGGYALWAANNGASTDPAEDSNHNGVPNGIEYFMGGTLASPAVLPPLVDNAGTWTWTIPYDPTAAASYYFQVSDDLSAWTDIGPPSEFITLLTGPDRIEFTLPAGKQFARLVVTPAP